MKRGKKGLLTLLLLAMVISLWSLIAWRMNKTLIITGSNETYKAPQILRKSPELPPPPPELNYPDPFGSWPKKKTKDKPHKRKKVESAKSEGITIPPKFEFLGMMKSKGIGIAIIKENGQTYHKRKGESLKEWEIHRIGTDILVLTKGSEKLELTRK